MSVNLKTEAVVLRRTNYGEADRILTLLTPAQGRVTAIAHGARRAKSKLAGGIELLARCELCLARGDNNRDGMWTVTSSAIMCFYDSIVRDYDRLSFAYEALKRADDLSGFIESPELYDDVVGTLELLNSLRVDVRLAKAWLYLKLARLKGGELNLITDDRGERLAANEQYDFNIAERAFVLSETGSYGADMIKLLRVLTAGDARLAERLVLRDDRQLTDALYLATAALESC